MHNPYPLYQSACLQNIIDNNKKNIKKVLASQELQQIISTTWEHHYSLPNEQS